MLWECRNQKLNQNNSLYWDYGVYSNILTLHVEFLLDRFLVSSYNAFVPQRVNECVVQSSEANESLLAFMVYHGLVMWSKVYLSTFWAHFHICKIRIIIPNQRSYWENTRLIAANLNIKIFTFILNISWLCVLLRTTLKLYVEFKTMWTGLKGTCSNSYIIQKVAV